MTANSVHTCPVEEHSSFSTETPLSHADGFHDHQLRRTFSSTALLHPPLWPSACGCQVKPYRPHRASRSGNARSTGCSPFCPYSASNSVPIPCDQQNLVSYHPQSNLTAPATFCSAIALLTAASAHPRLPSQNPGSNIAREPNCVHTNITTVEGSSCGFTEEAVSEIFVIAGRISYG